MAGWMDCHMVPFLLSFFPFFFFFPPPPSWSTSQEYRQPAIAQPLFSFQIQRANSILYLSFQGCLARQKVPRGQKSSITTSAMLVVEGKNQSKPTI